MAHSPELYLNGVLFDIPLLPIESETYIASRFWYPYGRGDERLVVPNKFAAGPTGKQDLDVVDILAYGGNELTEQV